MAKKESKKSKKEIGYIKPREITEEMRESYIDYAMSVIISRALPDVRDGLKPVQRRILYSMYEMGLRHDAKFRKSATVVGECLGKFHPHGDQSVYNAAMRMAQDFSLRYPLIQGQGNVGCFTKDTRVRLTDGRSLTFGKLIREQKRGKRHWTFSFNPKGQKIEIAEIKNPRLTRRNEKIIEVALDNGQKIKCTLDHRFMLKNGKYKQARDLKPGDSLMPLYSKRYDGKEDKNLKEYEMIYQPFQSSWEFTHHLAKNKGKWNPFYGKRHTEESKRKMSEARKGKIGYWWGKHFTEEHRKKLSEAHKDKLSGRVLSEEIKKKISEAHKGIHFSEEHKRNLSLSHVGKKGFWAGKKRSEEDIEKFRTSHLGKKQSEEWIMKRIKKGKEHYNWQGGITPFTKKRLNELRWRKIANQVRQRDNNTCQLCGFRDDHIKLPVHHLVPFKISKCDKLNNLITLCPSCHNKLEYRRKRIAKKQWKTPEFREKIIEAVKARNKQRLKENPDFMKELAQRAKISLRKNWQNPSYKERVMRSKILGYVYSLLEKHSKVTPEIYEKERTNNGVPKIENALNYFDNFSEIVVNAQKYNHKVISTRILRKREDVYDLTIKPWHNFVLAAGVFVHNSIDDPNEFAAMRYTEMRLSKIGEEMLRDIGKDTVDFVDNYDRTKKEPTVLPSPLPQLLLNGSLGIAVGMATNIPPHNLGEIVDATIYLIDHSKADTEDLFKFIKGPDFPTGGKIYGQKEMITTYSQGKGPIVIRGKTEILRKKGGKTRILITEIPFQVRKSSLIEQFANLVQKKKRVRGIKNIRDESDKEGLRIVIGLSRDAYPRRVLNQLYKFTDLQKTFYLNMLALIDGIQPRVLSLVDLLSYFINHRKEVIFRRTKYDLEKTKQRAHILEGLNKCLGEIDKVIKTIKASKDKKAAEKNLIKEFKLTKVQATAILETKLSALARLERKKIEKELKKSLAKIRELKRILKSPKRVKEIIRKELKELKENFGDERRTKIIPKRIEKITLEDLIPQKKTIITLTQAGFIKRISPRVYKIQRRGGKGILGMKTVKDDLVEHFLLANTHDSLLFFTDSGKVFKIPAYEIPKAGRVARGRGLLNFLDISPQEKVLTILPFSKGDLGMGIKYLVMATQSGIIKKTEISEFENIRRSGLIAIKLKKNDLLEKVKESIGTDEIILVTQKGQAIRFGEKEVRPMGRSARGVKGIGLRKGDKVVGMDVIKSEIRNQKSEVKRYLLIVTEKGYGKRTDLREYRLQKRGGIGLKTAKITSKNGNIVFSKLLTIEKDLIVISQQGKVIRAKISSIPKFSRSTQGVKIMKLEEGDRVASATCI